MTKGKQKEWAAGLIIIFLMMFAALVRFFDPLELLFLDLRFHLRGERKLPADLVLIGIDEASLDHPKAGPWPWPRGFHAKLLYALNRDETRPAVLGYELLFEGENPKDEPGDRDLAYRSTELGERLVLGYFFEKGYRSRYEKEAASEARLENFALRTGGTFPENLESFDKVSLPYPELAEGAALGFLNLPRETGGSTRRLRLLAQYRGKVYPSFDLLLVLKYWSADLKQVRVTRNAIEVGLKDGLRKIPVTPEGDIRLYYYGRGRSIRPYYPFIQAVMGESLLAPADHRRMEAAMKGKIVLVGRTAYSLKEAHTTPFEPAAAGIFIRAQGIGNLLEGSSLRRVPAWGSAVAILLLGAAAIGILRSFPLLRSLGFLCAVAVLYAAANLWMFSHAIWMDGVVQMAALFLLFAGIVSLRYFTALEELKRTQNELIHSAKMATVGQISSGMAHEFRNMLHALRLHVEGCARPGMKPEKVGKYMAVIFKMMNHAETVLNGILSFSRKDISQKKPGLLENTVEDVLLLLKKELQYRRIRVVRNFASSSLVEYDTGQISQVLMNLINNARDALQDRSEKVIMIRLREDGRNVYLDIADNGPGIAEEVLERLFEPFVTTKEEGRGTGLGLSLCRDIVENHGGTLTVTSVPGEGTVWHITLPK